MSGQDLFERILASFHEAVFDDELWPSTSGLIDQACGSKGNHLITGDGMSPDDIEIFHARFCYGGQRRPDLERMYFKEFHELDERLPRVRRLPHGRVVHGSTLFTEDEKKSSVVYNEVLPDADTADSLCVRLDGPRGSRIAVSMADPADGHGWSSARVGVLERLLPHLRQYVLVRQALVDAGALGSSAATLLENTRCGVIHLDRRGRIVAANDVARALLRKGDGLADRDGFLCAAVEEDDEVFQRLLARVLPPFGAQGESGSMHLPRTTVSPRLALHASPMGGRVDARPSRVAALVLAIDPAGWNRIDPALVAEVLGLTPAQSHIAVLLAQGRSIRDIALAVGRKEGTIRWHTKQIFRRHRHISGQSDLVRLVLSLADFPQGRI